ncbi:GNAT family N-acetyltransferase [cf. Phormidesmis sp. LEGE 11477]|uniref:GNAT family N-acetyltransferase n=1 Tax=cf. Phormidesmis sp. LEGE 11477 TaxID=1828680 RepID=UPI00187E0AEA|nr:GNAT family N-acetyltransferase [cf. Phormidesmis sp. LEGE 11477]MBE9059897.1 GNAT family N-acetyltransferase [cf. Phormidesmis sp. LEGE 11477]
MTRIYELETDRLRLRQWKEADKLPFAQLNADERVMEFFPQPLSRSQSDALADKIISTFAQKGWGWWAVELKEKHDFIGFVGLNVPSADLPFQPCVEVGWRLDYSYWGYGYATEAARVALAFGFETLALEKIVSFTALVNKRSEAVMRKLGMCKAAQTFMHPDVPVGSELREHCLYELSREN